MNRSKVGEGERERDSAYGYAIKIKNTEHAQEMLDIFL